MRERETWLSETENAPLEEMSAFFSTRLDTYEEHMSAWKNAYRKFASLLPRTCKNILDLGCGTGLELDEIFKLFPNLCATGVDLCKAMLNKLSEKHADRRLETVCADYLCYDFSENAWDAIVSFQSFHHFFPETKLSLYRKIHAALKTDSPFLLADYIACCDEEETLLKNAFLEKRKRFGVPDGQFVHFDIPLTLPHELSLLRKAGFSSASAVDSIDGTTIVIAKK